jgi:NADPH:quinone reductase-like Zn-dependent oxidoreductase
MSDARTHDTMQVQQLERFGEVDGFRLVRRPRPTPGPGQVLVRIAASSVNVADVKARELGHALDFVPELPAVLGMDFAGTVAELGAGVTDRRVGDRVFGCAGGVRGLPGALAEYIVADDRLVARAPSTLPLGDAAALPLAGITAWEALDRTGVDRSSHVLVYGGTGGVGHLAVQLAKARGARVTATAAGADGAVLARALGADEVVDYRTEPVTDYVDRLTGGSGFDVVIDTVGADNLSTAMAAAALNARIATTVALQSYDLTPAHVKGLSIHVVYMLIPMMHGVGREYHGTVLDGLSELVDGGRLRPLIDSRFGLADAPAAHTRLASGDAVGKVLVEVAR